MFSTLVLSGEAEERIVICFQEIMICSLNDMHANYVKETH